MKSPSQQPLSNGATIWVARANSRRWFLGGFVFCAVSVLLTDSAAVVPKLYLLLWACYHMVLQCRTYDDTREAFEKKWFSFAVAAFSSCTLVYFVFAALGYFPEGIFWGKSIEDKSFSFNNLARMMAHRMQQGEFPCPMIPISLILPTLATTAGMDTTLAKYSTMMNAVIFSVFLLSVHSQFPPCEQQLAYFAARASLVHETILTTGLSVMCLTACAPGVEAADKVVRLLNASTLADTVLNHVLKVVFSLKLPI